MKSLSKQTKISATRGAYFVLNGIPTICPYNKSYVNFYPRDTTSCQINFDTNKFVYILWSVTFHFLTKGFNVGWF